MKKIIVLSILIISIFFAVGQNSSKKESRKNLTIKEWKTPVRGTRHLDHITKYDANGRKIEEIEYSQSGMKARCTYEYDANGKMTREVVYDEYNKPYRIKKFEYNSDGTKKRQLNYNAKGNLVSTKDFEYIKQ